jgi:flagellin-like protein
MRQTKHENRKAISPLIATVILLVVTVGIGAVVTSMVRNYAQENKNTIDTKGAESACSRDVLVEIVTIDQVTQVCKGTGYIDFILENRGANIDDFKLMVFGATGFATNDSLNNGTFAKGSSKEINFTYNPAGIGTIQEIKLVPKLKVPAKTSYFYCSEAALSFEGMEDC